MTDKAIVELTNLVGHQIATEFNVTKENYPYVLKMVAAIYMFDEYNFGGQYLVAGIKPMGYRRREYDISLIEATQSEGEYFAILDCEKKICPRSDVRYLLNITNKSRTETVLSFAINFDDNRERFVCYVDVLFDGTVVKQVNVVNQPEGKKVEYRVMNKVGIDKTEEIMSELDKRIERNIERSYSEPIN